MLCFLFYVGMLATTEPTIISESDLEFLKPYIQSSNDSWYMPEKHLELRTYERWIIGNRAYTGKELIGVRL